MGDGLAETINWGIAGLGRISSRFAGTLMTMPDARIAGVASRDHEKAMKFAAACGATGHASLEAMLADPAITVVYIGSINSAHKDQAIACLEAGKAVLIEKPIASTGAEARAIAAAAQKAGRFAMEAMWTRFLPAVSQARHLVTSGKVGRLTGFQADLSFHQIFDSSARFFDAALAGGGLLDLGVYPLSLAVHFLGVPKHVVGHTTAAPSGVDQQASLILDHGSALSTISCGFSSEGPNDGVLMGEKLRIRLQRPLYAPAALITSAAQPGAKLDPHFVPSPGPTGTGRLAALKQASRPSRQSRFIPAPFRGDGFVHQVEEVHRCLRAGLRQSPIMPLDDSLAVLDIIDQVQKA
jgi:predicted dehydrogenase